MPSRTGRAKLFAMLKSTFHRPGSRIEPRPTLPGRTGAPEALETGISRKTAGFRYCKVCREFSNFTGPPPTNSPRWPGMDELCVTVTGSPLLARKIPETCQPPRTDRAAELGRFAKEGASYIQPAVKKCVRSYDVGP